MSNHPNDQRNYGPGHEQGYGQGYGPEYGQGQPVRPPRRRATALIAAAAAVVLVGGGVALSIGLADSGPAGTATAPVATGSASGTAAAAGVPAHASGPGGTEVVYGKADAPATLDVYEDLRCPVCDRFERTDGAMLQQLADQGVYRIQFHLATFLDRNLGGSGSQNALAALGAALDRSTAMFQAYRTVLYANQPDERTDGFADDNRLLELASKVPGLRTAAFDQAVRNGTYQSWAAGVGAAFNSSGVDATPTVRLNGKDVKLFDDSTGQPISPAQFKSTVEAMAAAK